MEGYNENIEQLIRSKFDSYAPTPPEHVWDGVASGIESASSAPFITKKRIIASALILLLAIIGFLAFNPFDKKPSNNYKIVENFSNTDVDDISPAEDISPINITPSEEMTVDEVDEIAAEPEITINQNVIEEPVAEIADNTQLTIGEEDSKVIVDTESENAEIYISSSYSGEDFEVVAYYMSSIELRNSFNIENNGSSYDPENRSTKPIPSDDVELELPASPRNSAWRLGFYLSPEITVSNIDSVEILNTYNFSIEPTYFFNDHWFVSTGIGLAYTRDRGYARIQYIVNEYMGSYDDVYDITFDTISGNVVPTYHTKTVEVWDTVRHISVSSITNQYLYLQVPVLFGYSFHTKGSPFSWYAYGGPAVSVKTGSWIEDPKPNDKDADIIDLKNNLPIRADSYYQLWLGIGLQYELNKKLSLAVEPGYRHYLSNIYINNDNKGPSSGFNVRLGLIYKMK